MVTYEIRVDRLLYGLLIVIIVGMLCLMYQAPDVHFNREERHHQGHLSVGDEAGDIHLLKILHGEDEEETEKDAVVQRQADAAPVICDTLIPQQDPTTSTFTKHEKTDSKGGDLFAVHTKSTNHLELICAAIPECVGFNSNGWLKKYIGEKYHTKTDLFVKDSASVNEATYLSARIIEDNYGKDYTSMVKNLKIYVYDLKSDQNITTVNDYKYGVEKLFIELIGKSSFRTDRPEEAHLFFIPSRCTSYRKTKLNLIDGVSKAQEVMREIMREVKSFPYWERTLGSDHFYICAHDMGTDLTLKSDRNLLKNSIALVNTADYDEPNFIPHKDISLPPHPSHGKGGLPYQGKGGLAIDPTNRTTLAFFAGTIDRGRIRPSIQSQWSKDADFRIFVGQMSQDRYIHHLKTSQFCLCLRGNEAWSPRLMDALWFGCIPVIISDYYDLPLNGLFDWREIAVFVRESQYEKLKEILRGISETQIESIQHKIKQIYAHLTWNDPPLPYDAFHSVLHQLWQRRHVLRY